MKFVEVISSLNSRGGAEVFLISLSKGLSKKNEVYLLSLYDGLNPLFEAEINKSKIHYICCHKKSRIDFKAASFLRKTLKRIQPDIVNFHLSFLATYYLAFGTRKHQWQLIETFHSIPGSDLTRFDNFLRKKYINKSRLSFIGISDRITKSALDKFGPINIQTIYNGIDLDASRVDAESISEKDFDFICVANMLAVKNHALLLEAFKLFLKRFPQSRLLLVGGGPMLEYNKDLSVHLEISDHVVFTGFVDDVRQFYLRSKIFVLASKREGNPISILEAMSFGLPVIAPNVGGIPDIVQNEYNGFLFENGSKEELLQCMLAMRENEEKMARFAATNVDTSKKYGIEFACDKYAEYFNRIVASSK